MTREHHMVRYWREVREIADEEGISVEAARGRWSNSSFYLLPVLP